MPNISLNQVVEVIKITEALVAKTANRRDTHISDPVGFAKLMSEFGLDGNGKPGYFGRNRLEGTRVKDNGGLTATQAVGEFLKEKLGDVLYQQLAKVTPQQPLIISQVAESLQARGITLNQGPLSIDLNISPEDKSGISVRDNQLHNENISGTAAILKAMMSRPAL